MDMTPARPLVDWRLLLAAFALSTLAYAWYACNPLPTSDAWFFLESFVSRALSEQGVGWRDFFAKRGSADHAQPLHRLMLLASLHWFDLDFRAEGIAAALVGVGCAWYLGHRTRRDMDASSPAWLAALPGMVLLSLNGTMIYTWPLVTQTFLAWPFLFALFLSLLPALRRRNAVPLLAAALGLLLVAGNAGVLGLAAALALAVLLALRERCLGAVWRVLAAAALALLLVKILLPLALPADGGSSEGAIDLQRLVAGWRDAWQWVLVPLASALVHIDHFGHIADPAARAWQASFGTLVLLLHAWFWRTWWLARPTAATVLAAGLMLSMYGATAGLLLVRVPGAGAEYLHQPRYVMLYQLSGVALAMMLALRRWAPPLASLRGALIVSAAAGLVALQLSLSVSAWREARYIRVFHERMAAQLHTLALDPTHPPPGCFPILIACQLEESKRRELTGLLRRHQLNLYSPRFQVRHRLRPTAVAGSALNKPSSSRLPIAAANPTDDAYR